MFEVKENIKEFFNQDERNEGRFKRYFGVENIRQSNEDIIILFNDKDCYNIVCEDYIGDRSRILSGDVLKVNVGIFNLMLKELSAIYSWNI